ncbi:MAG: SirB2 family protein [Pseudomonadota bacterium]
MDYPILLALHRLTVVISITLFALRGAWRMLDSPMNAKKWVKVVPHVNDTLLLLAAIGMLVVAGLNPMEHGWIMAKIIGLIIYIVLGTVAIKRGKSAMQRNLAFVGALAVFGYIAMVAVTKQVVPF